MWPAAGFWKPEMILISVDLPAPLSPSSPSTSPFFKCRLMSCRAVTGPKRLAMCSTRRTSADAGGGALGTGAVPASATAVPPSRTTHVHIGGHRDDDCNPRVEEQVVRVHALQDQTVFQDAQEQ